MASDFDFCEQDGKPCRCYSWGNQHGTEFLITCQADGVRSAVEFSAYHD